MTDQTESDGRDHTRHGVHEGRLLHASPVLPVRDPTESDPLGLACEHGMLARSCEVCELHSTVRALEAQVHRLDVVKAGLWDQSRKDYVTMSELRAERDRLTAEVAALRDERDLAVAMLAGWCVAVDEMGTGWDDWDEYYKDAMWRPCAIRGLLDEAIAACATKEEDDD